MCGDFVGRAEAITVCVVLEMDVKGFYRWLSLNFVEGLILEVVISLSYSIGIYRTVLG